MQQGFITGGISYQASFTGAYETPVGLLVICVGFVVVDEKLTYTRQECIESVASRAHPKKRDFSPRHELFTIKPAEGNILRHLNHELIKS